MKLTPRITELIGIICGDGNIRYKPDKNQYYIEITGNIQKEKQYFHNLKKEIKRLLNINCSLFGRQRAIRFLDDIGTSNENTIKKIKN